MNLKCFLIEPVYDASTEPTNEDWSPGGSIVGWVRKDTGERHEHNHQFGPGAMWYAVWYPKNFVWDNETGPHLIVRCPSDRDWDVDSRCSNCGLPDDKIHRCWVRHGEPPAITVDKAGATCDAGAGSIALPNWHGFLRDGELVAA